MALLKYFKRIEPSKEEEIQRCAAITRWSAANNAVREILTNNPIDEDSPSPCNKIMLKAVLGTYQVFTEKEKAEVARRAAEHRITSTIRYFI